jgi:hypothetical protein
MKQLGIFAALVVAGALTLLAVNPIFSTPATPRWEVWVVDENAHPLQGMIVRLSWENYSAETTEHQEDLRTDQNGYVVFRERTLRVKTRDWIVGTMRSIGMFPHGSFGPHAYVFAFGNGLEGDSISGKYLTDWTGTPGQMQSRIIAKSNRLPTR